MKEIFLAAAILFFGKVEAQEVCVSFFAMPGFSKAQCTTALEVFDGVKHPCLVTLWGTFGESTKCLKRFPAIDKPKTLEIHGTNETCRGRAGRVCVEGEVNSAFDFPDYSAILETGNEDILVEIEKRAQEIRRFIESNDDGKTRFLVSTGLEDNFTRKAFKQVFPIYKHNLSSVASIVRNPMEANETFTLGSDYFEFHGVFKSKIAKRHKGRCIFNYDGRTLKFPGKSIPRKRAYVSRSEVLSDIKRARNNNCKIALWWGRPQGSYSAKFVEPRRRRLVVTRRDIRFVNRILRAVNQ